MKIPSKQHSFFVIYALVAGQSAGCYFVAERKFPDKEGATADGVIGLPLGEKAGGPDELALQDLYAVKTTQAPAALRPDPDTFARQRLREYREEGKMVARLIGSMEPYRALLGGASEDFRTTPSETYDATSLLAVSKVAEQVCDSLVNPNSRTTPGWTTILPYEASRVRENLTSLAQRITGLPQDRISETTLDALEDLMNKDGLSGNAAYVTPCMALMLDASSLLF